MVLPLIPLVFLGVGVASGAAGAVNGVRGGAKLQKAKRLSDRATTRYVEALTVTEAAVDGTNACVADYGAQQEAAHRDVVRRMADFLRRNERLVSTSTAALLAGVDVEVGEIAEYAGTLGPAVDWVGGAAKAGVTGAAVYTGVPAAVGAVAHASTGTAISALHGAAATNATLAWLGGGSLAVGGGGMALGAATLNVVTIGPALLVTGLVLNGQGEKATTRAAEYEAAMDVAIANQHSFRSMLEALNLRVEELGELLSDLATRAEAALETLESEDFDPQVHAQRFQDTLRLVLAVRDVIVTPVVTEDGEVNVDTERILLKHRDMS